MSRKVKLVTSSGVELGFPLSDGQTVFEAGIVYTVNSYEDFHRLIKHGDFVEVIDEPVVAPEQKSEILEEAPKEDVSTTNEKTSTRNIKGATE